MGDQLALFDVLGPAASVSVPPPEPQAVVAADDPRQTDLFGGPYRERHDAEQACWRLDGAALREAYASAARSYPQWVTARAWPEWADGLDWLAPSDPDERAARALSLDREGAERFAEMPAAWLAIVRREALTRAARAILEARGPAAYVLGRPAGWLLLVAGLHDDAARVLGNAVEAAPFDARVHACLGLAHARAGRPDDALAAWRDACLLDPQSLDERDLSPAATDLLDLAADLEDLPGDPSEWLPALADLTGAAMLPPWASGTPPDASPARRFAALLRTYRDAQAAHASESRRRELKRAMLALAPATRELVRRV